MKRTIIIISNLSLWSLDNNKGAPSFYKTVEGYANYGWDVFLISSKANNNLVINNSNIHVLEYRSINDYVKNIKKLGFFIKLVNSLYCNYKFYNIAKKIILNCDTPPIIYSYEIGGVQAGKLISEKYNLPFITRFQGTILAPVKKSFINKIKYFYHFQSLRTTADITIMTDDGTFGDIVLNDLNNKSKQRLFLRNGVDLYKGSTIDKKIVKKSFNIDSEDMVLLTLSRLVSWKKVDRAINALSQVIKIIPNVKLVIIGDGSGKENLVNLVNSLGLNDYVIFTGAINHTEVYNYIQIADIFLSLYDLSNLGNPLFEAMVCGKSIITLNTGNTSSIIKDNENGIIVNSNELHLIPEKIIYLLKNQMFSQKLGEAAKIFADKNFWDWNERISTEIKEVEKLLSKGTHK